MMILFENTKILKILASSCVTLCASPSAFRTPYTHPSNAIGSRNLIEFSRYTELNVVYIMANLFLLLVAHVIGTPSSATCDTAFTEGEKNKQ